MKRLDFKVITNYDVFIAPFLFSFLRFSRRRMRPGMKTYVRGNMHWARIVINIILAYMKYDLPGDQSEILPNILNLKSKEEIGLSEFEGFLKAEIVLSEQLTSRTKFNTQYILQIHKLSLYHLYSFAGKLRDVNISKGGFPFPGAKFLRQSMNTFDDDILKILPNKYPSKEELIRSIATVHGELLFIHPFREGNGRTARILANLMAKKQGYEALLFDRIAGDNFDVYVKAIQKSAEKDYKPMVGFITSIFPG